MSTVDISGIERRYSADRPPVQTRGTTAAQILLRTLALHGVDRAFCVPGESYLALLDAMHDDRSIGLVTCRHESSAGFMANADARLTGRIGVCLVSRGPGATNAAIAVHSAQQDAVPLLLLIGQVRRRDLGRGALQEVDYVRMFGAMAKLVEEVRDPDALGETAARAIRVAYEGTPGPVVLSLPEDMLAEPASSPPIAPGATSVPAARLEDLERAAAMIGAAERPFLIAGGGLENPAGRETLRRFSEAWKMAVAVSFRRNDLFPNDHPLFAGELGVGNSDEQLMAFSSSDLILAVGTRLGDITTQGFSFPTPPRPRQPLIHVHASQRVLGALFACELAIPADPITFLQQLLDRNGRAPAGRDAWNARLGENRRHVARWNPRQARDGVPMNNVIARMGQLLPADAIVATDAGIHAGGVYRYIAYSASRPLLAPVSGAMGYGMPAGVAAALRHPGRKVAVFVGDGGFLMTGSELATAVQHRLPVCVVLSNNRSYGSVRVWQERDYPGRLVGTDLHNPDFAALANAYGARGYRIDSIDDIDRVLEPALAESGPTLIEVRSSLEVNFPKR